MAELPWRGELVVCDNNSTDDTAAIAAAAGARVVFEPFNQISRARNAGARAARGAWLSVCVDADTRVGAALPARGATRLASGRCAGGSAAIALADEAPLLERGLQAVEAASRAGAGLPPGLSCSFAPADAFAETGGFSEKVCASEGMLVSRADEEGLGSEPWDELRHHRLGIGRDQRTQGALVSTRRLAGYVLLLAVCRCSCARRTFCGLWYRRPGPRGRDR